MNEHPKDPARDPLLSEALRHAPDRDVVPPAALDDAIRREAHAAVRTGASHAQVAGRLTHWLDRWRLPSLAGALGTVMMATVVGLMWRDGPPPDPMAPPVLQEAAPPPPADSRDASAPVETAPAPAAPAQKDVRALAKKAEASVRERQPVPPASPAPTAMPAPAIVVEAPRARAESEAVADRAAAAPQSAPGARSPAAGRSQLQTAAPADPLAGPLAALASATVDSAAGLQRARLITWQSTLAGRWQEGQRMDPEQGEPVANGTGQVLGWLRIETDRVTWQSADSDRSWSAAR